MSPEDNKAADRSGWPFPAGFAVFIAAGAIAVIAVGLFVFLT